ncbi:hypothetical protein NL676_003195 [Syzygium grande]|nr:hypothetical protein NL676_003195 [Syzygium grande]
MPFYYFKFEAVPWSTSTATPTPGKQFSGAASLRILPHARKIAAVGCPEAVNGGALKRWVRAGRPGQTKWQIL